MQCTDKTLICTEKHSTQHAPFHWYFPSILAVQISVNQCFLPSSLDDLQNDTHSSPTGHSCHREGSSFLLHSYDKLPRYCLIKILPRNWHQHHAVIQMTMAQLHHNIVSLVGERMHAWTSHAKALAVHLHTGYPSATNSMYNLKVFLWKLFTFFTFICFFRGSYLSWDPK